MTEILNGYTIMYVTKGEHYLVKNGTKQGRIFDRLDCLGPEDLFTTSKSAIRGFKRVLSLELSHYEFFVVQFQKGKMTTKSKFVVENKGDSWYETLEVVEYKDATFTSVWSNNKKITTICKVKTETHQIFDIEKLDEDTEKLGVLLYHYITIDGNEYAALNANVEDDIDESDYWFE